MTADTPPGMRRAPRRRTLWRALAVVGIFVAAVTAVVTGCAGFGASASGARKARMETSPQWDGGGFENPQPIHNDLWASLTAAFSMSPYATPDTAVPVVPGDASRFADPPETGLRVTWLGHSTLLIEIDGQVILTDPIFGERSSPFEWIGPQRWYPPPIPLDQLPPVDAVVISHDHYDHLQAVTIEALAGWDTTFITPLGVGAHLERWGVPPARIVELDWWDSTRVGALEVVCAPARHASGRRLLDMNDTLWAGWALIGGAHRAFFSGDTGLFPGMRDIGERLGPFDVTMLEVGAYNRAWPDWHLGPEQAVRAHQMLGGRAMLPIHWGLWNLAMHSWTEPAERVVLAAEAAGVALTVPRPGESVEPERLPPINRWWPQIPWQSAQEHPIVSSQVD